jgi:endoglycosylceramidase
MRAALPVLALLGATACGASSDWHVRAGFLRGPDGSAVILRGVNLSGAQKSAPYLDDKTPDDYLRVRRDWGMNAIRFVMTWAAVEPEAGRYDDAYLGEVAKRLEWARTAGLSAVLDMHEDVYGEGFGFDGAPKWTCEDARYAAFHPTSPWFLNAIDPNVVACVDELYTVPTRRQHFIDAWKHVAERLAHSSAVIGFDVLNEPSWGTYPVEKFENDRLAPLYAEVVAAVRAVAPSWVAFLEPSGSRNIGVATSLSAFGFKDVMYAPHSYDAAAESGRGFDPSSRTHVLDNVAKLAGEARVLNAGLWVGEYGGMADKPGIVEYMTAQYDAIGEAAGGSMVWAYDKSGGYGLLTPEGTETPLLVDAVVRPYPARVAGDPIRYAFTASTATFRFEYAPDPMIGAPTEIIVPSRVYPNGYQVECDGCRSNAQGDVLLIETPPKGCLAAVLIRP